MKRLVLVFVILVSFVLGEQLYFDGKPIPKYEYDLTSGEGVKLLNACLDGNQQACKTLISKANLEQDAKKCLFIKEDPDEERFDAVLSSYILQHRTCKKLGLIFFNAKEYHISKAFFERLCQAGGYVSCYILGGYYDFGYGVKQDYLKARELYKKSCDMKFGGGCFGLATLYHDGLGVRQNLSIAKQYAGKACDLGYQEGCNLYRDLNEKGVQ